MGYVGSCMSLADQDDDDKEEEKKDEDDPGFFLPLLFLPLSAALLSSPSPLVGSTRLFWIPTGSSKSAAAMVVERGAKMRKATGGPAASGPSAFY